MHLFLTGIACSVAGVLGMLLGDLSGSASPFIPAAGVALACVLVWGNRMAPMVAAVSFLIHLNTTTLGPNWHAATAAAFISLGVTLQALVGAMLIRRFVRYPLTLTEPRDLVLFYSLGAASCLLSATMGAITLANAAVDGAAQFHFTWLTWWSGDTLGVILATPIMLTLIGQPSQEWRAKRFSVGVTLTIASVMLALGMSHVLRLDRERATSNFNLDIATTLASLETQLQQPLNALEAIRSTHELSNEFSRNQFKDMSARWLRQYSQILALGWSERVAKEKLGSFEAKAIAEGLKKFRVHGREQQSSVTSPSIDELPIGNDIISIRYIEPQAQNDIALGFNSWSVPEARQAISLSTLRDEPIATRGFSLIQGPSERHSAMGVVIYHAIYRGQPRTETQRIANFRGVVFATLRMDDLLNVIQSNLPNNLIICILDQSSGGAQVQRLAGPVDCEKNTQQLMRSERLLIGGRTWELRIFPRQDVLFAQAPQQGSKSLMSLISLACAGMLGALLLTVTGRTGRIEDAVNARTAALLQEVKERERAEDALRESEQRFRNIFNIVPIAVAYADLRGKLKQVNPRFCDLVGFSNDELLSMNAFDFTHPEENQEDLDLRGELVRGEIDAYRRSTRYVKKHGDIIFVQCTVSLLRDAAGRPRRIVSAVEDISEHMRLDEAERAREAAEAANEAKSDFLSRMSHELRTPLNAMLGFAQLLELDTRNPLVPKQITWVDQIQQAGWHLLNLINEVLDLSRIETGNLQVNLQQLHLPSLLAATLPMIEHEAHRHGISITQSLPKDAVHLDGDATRVKQILTNLLSNAVKYNTRNGRIHLEAKREEDRIHISVTDSGLGMTREQMQNLFQPFNRLGRDRSAVEGTGIGLVISQRLAELMGGRLKVRSTPNKGTTFTLILPALNEVDITPEPIQLIPPSIPEYNRRVIHYIEDNETNVEVMRGILSLRPQIKLNVSYCGQEGLDDIDREKPHMILLDLHLPDMTGMQVLQQLKLDPETASIPVIIVSADAITSQISEVLAAGAVRYLTKPVSVSELLAALDAELEDAETRYGEP